MGVLDSSHEFVDFDTAFPSDWAEDGSAQGDQYDQVKYTFTPVEPVLDTGSTAQLLFEYEYVVEVRAFGGKEFSRVTASDGGVISISLRGSPFSRYSLFRGNSTNQSGWLLVFAGGNTENDIREIFNGPVHVNTTPYFFGSPIFNRLFTSGASSSPWVQESGANDGGSAQFNASSQGGHSGRVG